MADFKECVNKLIEASGNAINEAGAKDILFQLGKLKEQGFDEADLYSNLTDAEAKRLTYIRQMRRFNEVKNRTLVNNYVDRVLGDLNMDEAIDIPVLKHIPVVQSRFFNPLHKRIYDISREHYYHKKQLYEKTSQLMRFDLRSQDLLDYAGDKVNSANIYRELAAQTDLDNPSTSSVTGDEKAFQVAKSANRLLNDLFHRKQMAGSTIQYLKNRIFKNDWSSEKMSKWNKVDLSDLDFGWNGKKTVKAIDVVGELSGNKADVKRLQEEIGQAMGKKFDPNAEVSRKTAIRMRQVLKDEEFYQKVKDVLWGGGTRPKSDWIEFKSKVIRGNHKDLDEEILQDPVNAEMLILAGRGGLAEFSGLGRTIDLTPDQYVTLGDEFFHGENFLQRFDREIKSDSRVIADLEKFGSRPFENWQKFINELKVRTRDNPDFIDKDSNHVLDASVFSNKGKQMSKLASTMFGNVDRIDNPDFAILGNMLRALDAVSRLQGAAITALSDVGTKAIRTVMQMHGEGSVFGEIISTTQQLIKEIGPEEARSVIDSLGAGFQGVNDEILSHLRYSEIAEIEARSQFAKAGKAVDYVAKKAFQLNGLDIWTQANRRGSFITAQNTAYKLKDLEFDKLSKFTQEEMLGSGITEFEWDIVRELAETQDVHGNKLLNAYKLERLDLDKWKEVAPELSEMNLISLRQEISDKWASYLYKEAESMTIMPDVIDKMRLTQGMQAGSPGGEVARFISMYKSYAYGYFARTFIPMTRHATFQNGAEYLAAGLATSMLVFTLKDLAKGHTPRDFTQPKNMMALIGHIYGLPYLDTLTYAFTSDNPRATVWTDALLGPVLSDVTETAARTTQLIQDTVEGDADYGKYAARTFLPMLPFRNHPATAGIFEYMVYNPIMERISPRSMKNYRERLEEDHLGSGELFNL